MVATFIREARRLSTLNYAFTCTGALPLEHDSDDAFKQDEPKVVASRCGHLHAELLSTLNWPFICIAVT